MRRVSVVHGLFGCRNNDAEEWLYTTEAEEASLALMVSKQESLEADVRAACSNYFEAVETERLAKEKELEEEAKKAAAEREAEGDDDRAEKDTRRLTKPDRMRSRGNCSTGAHPTMLISTMS